TIDPSKITFLTSLDEIPSDVPLDIVIITVKSTSTATVAQSLVPYKHRVKSIVSLQNGIHNVEVISSILPDVDVVTGMFPFNVASPVDGRYHKGSGGSVCLEDKVAGRQLAELLNACGTETTVHKDMMSVLYGKLQMNLNNSIHALSNIPLKRELSLWSYRRILAALQKECLHVYAAAGIKPKSFVPFPATLTPYLLWLPDFVFGWIGRQTLDIDDRAMSSMWEDLKAARKTEIDELNGEVVSLGKKHNVPTPLNTAMVALIHQVEDAKMGSPGLSGAEIWKRLQNGGVVAKTSPEVVV
ncbi:hypothetical protein HK104_000466, partial [Borealophlyctis nickersoniae]